MNDFKRVGFSLNFSVYMNEKKLNGFELWESATTSG